MSENLQVVTYTELTTDEVAAIYADSSNNITLINTIVAKSTINVEDKATLKANVEHLEALKNRKKMNSDDSIWTTESFSTHDAAITAGKAKY
tara:strand:- start:50 stop:325 length:276 start_codon:yes stop_codon:yes gene_type:complete